MPARVAVADAGAGTVTLAADGAVPTELPVTSGRTDVVIPWLALRELGEPRWSHSAGQGGAVANHSSRYPRTSARRVRHRRPAAGGRAGAAVPGQYRCPGPPGRVPAAASARGGVRVARRTGPGRGRRGTVDESQVAVLLAAGTTIAVGSEAKPGGAWPWRREGAYWCCGGTFPGRARSSSRTPTSRPTAGRAAGRPRSARARDAARGAVRDSRGRPDALAVPVRRRGGGRPLPDHIGCDSGMGIAPVSGAVGRRTDRGLGRRHRTAGSLVLPRRPPAGRRRVRRARSVAPRPRPPAQAEESRLRLVCTPDGQPSRFTARLEADHALAVLTRSVEPVRPPHQPLGPVTSPLFVLANQLYPGKVLGQSNEDPANPDRDWGTIFLDASARPGP